MTRHVTEPDVDVDVVVAGAGAAGLCAALVAAESGLRIAICVKSPKLRSSRTNANRPTATAYAQGGIAAVDLADASDSVASHVADTEIAGAGLTDPLAAESIVGAGPNAIDDLRRWGLEFDTDATGTLHRTREGSHCVPRILHAGGDATGLHLQAALEAALIPFRDNGTVTVLWNCPVTSVALGDGEAVGLWAHRHGHSNSPVLVGAATTILATGGCGQLYSATTNPAGATGDGVALALRAGAEIADIEFIQFHPTMLYTPGGTGRCALVSEAVRGEGGFLTDIHGRPFMTDRHPAGDLAPRDVVARGVAEAMRDNGAGHVYLDVSLVDDFEQRFPTVTAGVRAGGYAAELAARRIPVVPGAHYQCGGVVTDTAGRTGIQGLLAVGEVARTGLHGANRLASNSLLEAVVTGRRAGEIAAARAGRSRNGSVGPSVPAVLPIASRSALVAQMSAYVGIAREGDELASVARWLDEAPRRIPRSTRDHEDAALTLTARAVVAAALARTESRGAHARRDRSQTDPVAQSLRIGLTPDGRVDVSMRVGV